MHAFTSIIADRKTQQRSVVLLALMLCLWLVAYATHLHAGDEGGLAHKSSTACSFCLSLPVGAAPPPVCPLAIPVFVSCVVQAPVYQVPRALDVVSSYLSRAPPAP